MAETHKCDYCNAYETHNSRRNGKYRCSWCKLEKRGCSGSTSEKERKIRAAIKVSLRMSCGNPRLLDYPFWYTSLNCGFTTNDCGSNADAVQFLEAVNEVNPERKYKMFLIDKEADFAHELRDSLVSRYERAAKDMGHTIRVLPGDNKDEIKEVIEEMKNSGENPKKIMGIWLSDPNGCSGESTPYDRLKEVREDFPLVDLIMVVNYSSINRSEGVNKQDLTKHWPFHSVSELMGMFAKTQWLISAPFGVSNCFVILIGRYNLSSIETMRKRPEFFPVKSDRGKEILAVVDKRCKENEI